MGLRGIVAPARALQAGGPETCFNKYRVDEYVLSVAPVILFTQTPCLIAARSCGRGTVNTFICVASLVVRKLASIML